MTEYEARQNGFYYTGMSEASWRKDEVEEMKKRAADLKKKYKGVDYRVVTNYCDSRSGITRWTNIYGNDLFLEVQYFNEDRELNYLYNGHNQILEKLQEEYNKKVEEEMRKFNERKEKYEKIMSLKNKKS